MQRMFGMVRELLTLSSSNSKKKDSQTGDFNKLFTRIEKYEGISDNMELEIAKYLDSVSDAHLSDDTKAKIRAMLREISELERSAMPATTWHVPFRGNTTARKTISLRNSMTTFIR